MSAKRGKTTGRKPSRTRRTIQWLAWGFTILTVSVIALMVLPFLLPSPFPVESYRKLADGSRSFEDLKFSDFDAHDHLLGFEKIADAEVSRLIYGTYFAFAFTKDGRVFVLGGCEVGAEPPLVDTLSWQGDPHEFPHFEKTQIRRSLIRPVG